MKNKKDELGGLSQRIKELGDKSTQILIFLSFAMVFVATLETSNSMKFAQIALNNALLWWRIALIPILLGVLPVKEFCWESIYWYKIIRSVKIILLWLAITFIFIGVSYLIKAF